MKTRELGRLRVQMWERNIIRSNQVCVHSRGNPARSGLSLALVVLDT